MLTLPGVTLTTVLFLWLGFSLWRNGGNAFSPGKLSGLSHPDVTLGGFTSHAEFENQCALCHQPLLSPQAPLCNSCHQNIQTQIDTAQGTHGTITGVQNCADCHKEHQGLNYNPVESALSKFDHNLTHFDLRHHLIGYDTLPLNCLSCHSGDQIGFPVLLEACVACHNQHDTTFMTQHLQDFGQNCLDCHDGIDTVTEFDHQTAVFPLEGAHSSPACSDCHKNADFKATSQACSSCHKEPDSHFGLFGTNCAGCHTTDSWQPAILNGKPFDHETMTSFSLVHHTLTYQQTSLLCGDCHNGINQTNINTLQTFNQQSCINCHTRQDVDFMAKHQAEYGPACLDCHDGKDRMRDFNHAVFFPIDGRHADLACVRCHQMQGEIPHFKNTPSECWQCHAEPQIHAGFFGLKCERCHETSGWTPALLHSHDFPLEHGLEANSPPTDCQVCHPSNYVTYTCYGCHEHQETAIQTSHLDEGIAVEEIPDCITCHAKGQKDDR